MINRHKELGGVKIVYDGTPAANTTVNVAASLFYIYNGVTGARTWYMTRWNQVKYAFGDADDSSRVSVSKTGADPTEITFRVAERFIVCAYGND